MKKILSLATCLLIALPALLHGQTDSKYLLGAVPEVDGQVVFSKEFDLTGASQEKIYDRMLSWANDRMAQNENKSKVVHTDPQTGLIVAAGEEFLVFVNSGLVLDQAWMIYQMSVMCQEGKCRIEIAKIRYLYEKKWLTAEGRIADGVALDKTKTNILKGMVRIRTKTIDFTEEMFDSAQEAMGIPKAAPINAPLAPAPLVQAPLVTAPAAAAPVVTAPEPAPAVTVATTAVPVAAWGGYKTISASQIPEATTKAFAEGSTLLACGKVTQFDLATARGGSLGEYAGKQAVFFMTDRPLKAGDIFTLTFYADSYREALQGIETASGSATEKARAAGLTLIMTPGGTPSFSEATVAVECRVVASQPMNQAQLCIGEILNVWEK